MDYGHTSTNRFDQTNDELFLHGLTEGSGDLDPNANSNNPAENLDTTDKNNWDQPLEHDKRAIGNTAINPVELSMPPSSFDQIERPPMGEITDLQPEAAPKPINDEDNLPTPDGADIKTIEKTFAPEIESIKITEQLNDIGVRTIEKEIQDFYSGKIGPAELYANERYDKIPAVLERSYGENANWKGKKAA